MIEIFRKLRKKIKRSQKNTDIQNKEIDFVEIPSYPPFLKGFPAVSPEQLLASQAELIGRLKMSCGLNEQQNKDLLLPLLHRYASFVHLLPASEVSHHRGTGGLFRHGLEVACLAVRSSDSIIFSINETPQIRRIEEPIWRFACCTAGLLHDIGKPITDMAVTDEQGGIIWNPMSESLYEWLVLNSIDKYYIHWKPNRHLKHEEAGILGIDLVITREIRKFLNSTGQNVILGSVIHAVAHSSTDEPLVKLIIKADSDSAESDRRENNFDESVTAVGIPVVRYVFDSIRKLIISGKWKINKPGGPVYYMDKGTFIDWNFYHDVADALNADKIFGVPQDRDTVADLIIGSGCAYENCSSNDPEKILRYFEILPDLSPTLKIKALKIDSIDRIYSGALPGCIRDRFDLIQSKNSDKNLNQENQTLVSLEPNLKEAPKTDRYLDSVDLDKFAESSKSSEEQSNCFEHKDVKNNSVQSLTVEGTEESSDPSVDISYFEKNNNSMIKMENDTGVHLDKDVDIEIFSKIEKDNSNANEALEISNHNKKSKDELSAIEQLDSGTENQNASEVVNSPMDEISENQNAFEVVNSINRELSGNRSDSKTIENNTIKDTEKQTESEISVSRSVEQNFFSEATPKEWRKIYTMSLLGAKFLQKYLEPVFSHLSIERVYLYQEKKILIDISSEKRISFLVEQISSDKTIIAFPNTDFLETYDSRSLVMLNPRISRAVLKELKRQNIEIKVLGLEQKPIEEKTVIVEKNFNEKEKVKLEKKKPKTCSRDSEIAECVQELIKQIRAESSPYFDHVQHDEKSLSVPIGVLEAMIADRYPTLSVLRVRQKIRDANICGGVVINISRQRIIVENDEE